MSGMGFGKTPIVGSGSRNRLLVSDTTTVTKSSIVPPEFYTEALPANTLQTNGDFLYLETAFDISVAGPNTLGVTFDSSSVASLAVGASPQIVIFQVTITRISAALLTIGAQIFQDGTSFVLQASTLATDLTVSQDISVVATALSGTVSSRYVYISYFKATS